MNDASNTANREFAIVPVPDVKHQINSQFPPHIREVINWEERSRQLGKRHFTHLLHEIIIAAHGNPNDALVVLQDKEYQPTDDELGAIIDIHANRNNQVTTAINTFFLGRLGQPDFPFAYACLFERRAHQFLGDDNPLEIYLRQLPLSQATKEDSVYETLHESDIKLDPPTTRNALVEYQDQYKSPSEIVSDIADSFSSPTLYAAERSQAYPKEVYSRRLQQLFDRPDLPTRHELVVQIVDAAFTHFEDQEEALKSKYSTFPKRGIDHSIDSMNTPSHFFAESLTKFMEAVRNIGLSDHNLASHLVKMLDQNPVAQKLGYRTWDAFGFIDRVNKLVPENLTKLTPEDFQAWQATLSRVMEKRIQLGSHHSEDDIQAEAYWSVYKAFARPSERVIQHLREHPEELELFRRLLRFLRETVNTTGFHSCACVEDDPHKAINRTSAQLDADYLLSSYLEQIPALKRRLAPPIPVEQSLVVSDDSERDPEALRQERLSSLLLDIDQLCYCTAIAIAENPDVGEKGKRLLLELAALGDNGNNQDIHNYFRWWGEYRDPVSLDTNTAIRYSVLEAFAKVGAPEFWELWEKEVAEGHYHRFAAYVKLLTIPQLVNKFPEKILELVHDGASRLWEAQRRYYFSGGLEDSWMLEHLLTTLSLLVANGQQDARKAIIPILERFLVTEGLVEKGESAWWSAGFDDILTVMYGNSSEFYNMLFKVLRRSP